MEISAWWESLSLVLRILWGIALIGSLLMVIQLVLVLIGGDPDGGLDFDADIDADTGAGFQFFTIKNITGFFTIFGWVSIACISSNLSTTLSLSLGILAGILMMFGMAALFVSISKLAEDGTMQLQKAIGMQAEVYLTIPANQSGTGKVQFTFQGSYREIDAQTKEVEALATGTIVKISGIVNNSILIVNRL